MATLRVPVRRSIFDYTMQIESLGLDLRIYYNARIDSWVADIIGQVTSIRLVGGINLLAQFYHLEVPEGELRIIDLDGQNREPTKKNFGDRVILSYVEP